MKEQLIQIYLNSLRGKRNEVEPQLLSNKFVERGNDGTARLTKLGRQQFKVVFTGGTYDLLHAGHLHTLREARSFGDVLIVVIARDSTVAKRKRIPFQNENERLELMNSLEIVDLAILGDETDHLKTVETVRPDIIALGADQNYNDESLLRKIHQRGLPDVELMRLSSDYEGLSTTKLIKKIVSRYCEVDEV